MAINICPSCGGKVSSTRSTCIHCGYQMNTTKVCPECNENLASNTQECPVCGYNFGNTPTPKSTAAICLWSFLILTVVAYLVNMFIALDVGSRLCWMFEYIQYGYIAGFIIMGIGLVGFVVSLCLLMKNKSKKIAKTRIVATLLMVVLLCVTFAPIVIHDPLRYQQNSDGTYTISGFENVYTQVDIPATYKGAPVVEIGNYVFYNCANLTSVQLPDTITKINSPSFNFCTSLQSIVIPQSVTEIATGAFYGCISLAIYCQAESKPDGWDDDWNFFGCPVYWAGEWHYDTNGNPVPNN